MSNVRCKREQLTGSPALWQESRNRPKGRSVLPLLPCGKLLTCQEDKQGWAGYFSLAGFLGDAS